jgi:RsiW-degrading membrane proteinase PrsW (M82 family)
MLAAAAVIHHVHRTSHDAVFALALAVVVAAVYLIVLRVVDVNEKEPVWATLLLLVMGAVGAAVLSVLVHARTLHGTTVLASVSDEVTIFICLALGIGLLEALGRLRGWTEVNGVVDGMLYGAAVGLGFAAGEAFIRELHLNIGALTLAGANSPGDTLWPTLLSGLAAGLFGGVMGAAFGLAVDATGMRRVALPLVGLALAFGLQVGYLELAHGNALSGNGARVREWIALGIPALFFLALLLTGLRFEQRAIEAELQDDPVAATPEELRLLTSPAARRASYLRRAIARDAHGWVGLRSLQNRQVQLALTKRRAARASDPAQRTELEAEVEHLRGAVAAARHHLQAGLGPAAPVAAEPN